MLSPRQTLTSLVAGLLLPSMAAVAAGKCERLVVTGSPDAPPYLWRDPQDPKRLMGANADLLKDAASQMGVKVELLFAGKRSQALEEVRTGRMDLLVDTPLNASELETLDFIHPPIAQNEIMVWTRAGHAQPFNSLADLNGHSGAISEKTRVTSAFESAIKEHLTLENAAEPHSGVAEADAGAGGVRARRALCRHGIDPGPRDVRRPAGATPASRQAGTVSGAVVQFSLQRSLVARTAGKKNDRIGGFGPLQ